MTSQHPGAQGDSLANHGLSHHNIEAVAQVFAADSHGLHTQAAADPVEAYFECITTCSLDDGECITTCTEMLREQV